MLPEKEAFFYTLASMVLPFFYINDISGKKITLDEATSKHIVSVLRMEEGEELLFTDGKGKKATAKIKDNNRKKCIVEVIEESKEERNGAEITIAISLIKNHSRFEWFLEKATEIGVSEIIPLICERTEKDRMKKERMQNIITSAMLQSQQVWAPVLHDATTFKDVVSKEKKRQNFIAHCLPELKQQLTEVSVQNSSCILIGPEGDFTEAEIQLAIENNFLPVALGDTRLRTETAGIVAATLLKIK